MTGQCHPKPAFSAFLAAVRCGIATLATVAGMVAGAIGPVRADGHAPLVLAAASTAEAMDRVLAAYAAHTGCRARGVYASSSTLARQIENGAPAALFLSANEPWMDHLAARDLIDPASRIDLLGNRLVLAAPVGTVPAPSPENDAAAVLRSASDGRIAVGDPDHVPAGIYAMQALRSLGLWDAMAPRLARAGNVRAALALVERGAVDLGIVYATDTVGRADVVTLAVFPEGSHDPIRYPAAVVRGPDASSGRRLLAFMAGDAARALFAAAGFRPLAVENMPECPGGGCGC